MDNLRLLAVVDRVVAWHNRHPLARRITAAQVHAVGYVALPFTTEAPPAAAPRPAEAAAQAIAAAAAAAAAAPLPVLTEVAPAAAAAAASAASPGEGSRLRERALARARERGPAAQAADSAAAFLATLALAALKPAFSEDFIDPLSPRQVARFARKHGRVLARAPVDGPVREVLIDTALIARQNKAKLARWPVSVYLLTAVIETDTRKSRVLLGLGPAVLGRRIHSPPRVAALAALSAGLVGVPLWLLRPAAPLAADAARVPAGSQASAPWAVSAPAALAPAAPASAAPAAPASAVPAAPASAMAAGTASAPGATPAFSPAFAPASATPPAEGPGQPTAMPLSEAALADGRNAALAAPPAPAAEDQPRRRAVNIVPMLSEAAKEQARAERRALMEAAAPPAAPVPTPLPEATPPPPAPPNPRAPAPPPSPAAARAPVAPVAPPPAPAAVPLSGPVFAISTRPLRTRAEAEQVQAAMQSLLASAAPAGLRVEVMPEGDDWRVVAMPYTRSAEAERGRALLASRGMRVKVVDF